MKQIEFSISVLEIDLIDSVYFIYKNAGIRVCYWSWKYRQFEQLITDPYVNVLIKIRLHAYSNDFKSCSIFSSEPYSVIIPFNKWRYIFFRVLCVSDSFVRKLWQH